MHKKGQEAVAVVSDRKSARIVVVVIVHTSLASPTQPYSPQAKLNDKRALTCRMFRGAAI